MSLLFALISSYLLCGVAGIAGGITALKLWRNYRRASPPLQLDMNDRDIRAALREIDEIAPNMPLAPPRSEIDMTEAEKVAAKAAAQQRAYHLAADAVASAWARNSVHDAAGNYLMPNGRSVSDEVVQCRGWIDIVEEELARPTTAHYWKRPL